MVSTFVTPASCSTSDSTATSKVIVSPREARVSTSSLSKIDFHDLPSVEHRFSQYGLFSSSLHIIMVVWRYSTKKQYMTHIKKLLLYCSTNNCDPVHPPLATALDFLTFLYQRRLSYSSINTARSALSSYCNFEKLDVAFGQLPVIKRFMKGVTQLRPSLPKHHSMWGVKSIFWPLAFATWTPTQGTVSPSFSFVVSSKWTTLSNDSIS